MQAETLDRATLEAAAKFEVFDGGGNKVTFGSLFAEQKTVVVFIRHFFCGSCKMYVEDLAQVPAAALAAAGTRIVLIGCGDWAAIQAYHGVHHRSYITHADCRRLGGRDLRGPDARALYTHLGLVDNLKVTPKDKARPGYLKLSRLHNTLNSIKTGYLAYPALAFKAGKVSQNGGDFVLGPGVSCAFVHRMQNTEDHVEVVDLMKAAGVEYAP
ncbi:hypothetical protein MIND_01060600 [Mycena indigotica]|uniref:Uncharacterized protein n=1 Tax=Mycena indigotica TaxID=2126181 RepID=A0A8H6VVB4_9AGAR|nr:uncharacterized protein MIND_01060600 [Mycena indigotica]KAF7295217.1 hypothetical protein MIND_01060600 [Mycena indigotica]